MRQLLIDPATSSLRIVLNLEKMVIAEAQRSFTYFHLFGYPTDLVVCNRVLPDGLGGYFANSRESQMRYWPKVEEAFSPVPVMRAPLFATEVVGASALAELATALFDGKDPSVVFHTGRPYRVERENGGFALTMELPFAVKDEIDLLRSRDELVVQVGPWRRNLILPRVLVDRPTGNARLTDGVLRISFGAPTGDKNQGGKR
jgi:arsenite-transporting ATPase